MLIALKISFSPLQMKMFTKQYTLLGDNPSIIGKHARKVTKSGQQQQQHSKIVGNESSHASYTCVEFKNDRRLSKGLFFYSTAHSPPKNLPFLTWDSAGICWHLCISWLSQSVVNKVERWCRFDMPKVSFLCSTKKKSSRQDLLLQLLGQRRVKLIQNYDERVPCTMFAGTLDDAANFKKISFFYYSTELWGIKLLRKRNMSTNNHKTQELLQVIFLSHHKWRLSIHKIAMVAIVDQIHSTELKSESPAATASTESSESNIQQTLVWIQWKGKELTITVSFHVF